MELRLKYKSILWTVALAVLASSRCSGAALAATQSPNPRASCARAEYAADQQSGQPLGTSSTPQVVLGDISQHLNTSQFLVMGRQVTVCAKGLYNWIYVQRHDTSKLHLMIGGQILKEAKPSFSPPEQEYVNFMLHMDSPDSDDWKAWAEVVNTSRESLDNKVTIGLADDTNIFESNAVATVPPNPDYWGFILAGLLCLLGLVIYLAARTSLLRSTIDLGSTSPNRAPFSLGLVQMAFWFFLALSAYVYLCVSTLQIHIPMGSVLGLLGISASTGLAAIAVDARKSAAAGALIAERDALNTRIEQLESNPPTPGSSSEQELAQKRDRLAQVAALINQRLPTQVNPVSKGFFKDILADGDGISFHRFQIAVWTLVLGVMFLWGVYRNMSMPTFDASLLTLMGISAGTYVGFKVPEAPKS
jgi:hypothetical protein